MKSLTFDQFLLPKMAISDGLTKYNSKDVYVGPGLGCADMCELEGTAMAIIIP